MKPILVVFASTDAQKNKEIFRLALTLNDGVSICRKAPRPDGVAVIQRESGFNLAQGTEQVIAFLKGYQLALTG